jgi:Mg-chelatase subunit ChlD
MPLEFTNKPALVLLLVLPVAFYLWRGSLTALGSTRRRVSLVARLLILLLMVIAVAGIRVTTRSSDVAVIFLADVSASVATSARQRAVDFINQEIERAPARDYIAVVAFGREPSVELAPTRKEVLGRFRLATIQSNPAGDYTDIAAAVRLARALVPEDASGRLVLISDGNENLESVLDETGLLRAEGIEVYSLPLEPPSAAGIAPEVAVTELTAPEKIAEGEAFDLTVTVAATVESDAALRVFRNETLIAERQIHLVPQGDNVFAIAQRAEKKGFYSYRAQVESVSADTFAQNNSREVFAVVEGRPKVLYLHGDRAPSAALIRVMADAAIPVDIRSSLAVPSSLAAMQDFDLVIFDNVPASALTTSQMKVMQAYIREMGGGFLMIGGDQSFGPGGYYKTPIEDLLPVSLDVRKKKHLPSLALVVVIDKSGSMSGEKMQLTQEAAAATASLMSERDSVGVVAFDSTAHAIVNLTPAEDKDAIIREIRSIQPVGGTNMYPGLKLAYDWLSASDARIKHVIVMSDGESEPGDFRGIARLTKDAGMTLTTVAVGADADFQTMKFIADTGGGRFYATDSPENLPRIFTREAFLASGSTIIEEPFVPRLIRATQSTQGIDWSAAPPLAGYVGTAERDDLTSPGFTSLISDKDDPVFASWQYGLGRSAAFTSDAKARWASGWMSWPGFGQFWTQVLRDLLRRENSGALEPRVEINSGRGRITVEAVTPDGEFANNLRPVAHVVRPDLSSFDVRLEQTAAGRYEGEFEATGGGAYMVRVADQDSDSAAVTGAVNSYSPEFNIAPADTNLLDRLGEATGGKRVFDPAAADLFERSHSKTRPHEIWRGLLLAALLLLPFDVGVRRLRVGREQFSSARAWLRARLRSRASAEPTADEQLNRLKRARARVKLGEGGGGDIVSPGTTETPTDVAGERPVEQPDESPLATRLLDARKKRGGDR